MPPPGVTGRPIKEGKVREWRGETGGQGGDKRQGTRLMKVGHRKGGEDGKLKGNYWDGKHRDMIRETRMEKTIK